MYRFKRFCRKKSDQTLTRIYVPFNDNFLYIYKFIGQKRVKSTNFDKF